MVRMQELRRLGCAALLLIVASGASAMSLPARAISDSLRCVGPTRTTDPGAVMGRPFLWAAYQALDRDRSQLAGLGPLRHSAVLSAIAERHSVYMASIGSWSDGDPEGNILWRVHAAGLTSTYAGQNVVYANGNDIPSAIQTGERFFAAEANGGGPHWDNITNPNHHFVGMGLAVSGGPGNWTVFLTQVFSDQGGCSSAAGDMTTTAAVISSSIHIGAIVHPSVDALQLRTEPHGLVISTLQAQDRLQIMDLQENWAQVKRLSDNTFGWVYAPLLTST